MASLDPDIRTHLEWIGFVRPTGLVVSAPALVRAGAILDRRDAEGQRLLRACVTERAFDTKEGLVAYLPDFRAFAESVLGWNFLPKGYAGTPENPIPSELEVPLPDYHETLRPDFAVRELDPKEGASPWQLLVKALESGEDFDRVTHGHGQLDASAHGCMERMLRQTRVPAGLLFNGRALRLLSAPRGESSGWLDFRVVDMVQTAGRPISTALRLLLGQSRLLALPRTQRLAALLEDSRKFQNEVSERLAQQVLHALYELLRGFQAAHDASKGELLRQPLTEHPDEVYRALLTVILRLVFLLFAEERDMLPEDETFLRYYSLAGLYERLRDDAALFPDTMDQRYGAWPQLLVLFRLIHDGAEAGAMKLPKRQGVLFDRDRFPFLEGRSSSSSESNGQIKPPLVPDGTIYRALDKLLVLDGERISYRALDVEQIGSVYETMMGFRLETTTGRSVAVRAQKKQGAPTAVSLEALLNEPSAKRDKWIQDRADRKLTESVKKAVAAAVSVEDLHAAMLSVIDLAATPDLVLKGAMVLQPSEERRRSGSHYTPRILTEPIVRTTLEPILGRLRTSDGRPPRPSQILDLKICDMAMGSGAFLVETCRQLADVLVEAWHAYSEVPTIPPDEDEAIFARRLIAQRCLYGVDRNPVAVDLAKVSLWLVTLAKDHPLTFVDHALRHGDSLVGLSRKQIEALNWDPSKPILKGFGVREALERTTDLRKQIREAVDSVSDSKLRELWNHAQVELAKIRLFGDLVLSAFFERDKAAQREAKRSEYASAIVGGVAEQYRAHLEKWRHADPPLTPFHWEIEFPEVFERENSGFDAFVGNPPFAGKNSVVGSNVPGYPYWLKKLHAESHGNADLVAHFFRRAFSLLRSSGAFGLIATNTIAQGDTRASGLRWICTHGGTIYHARKRLKWPGQAAVVVSVVHIIKGQFSGPFLLDYREVPLITAYLFHAGEHDDPAHLAANSGKTFRGCEIGSLGFLIAKNDPHCLAFSTLAEPTNATIPLLKPYIGGRELNAGSFERVVLDVDNISAKQMADLPQVLRFLEERVRPDLLARGEINQKTIEWWHFRRPSLGLRSAASLRKILAIAQTSSTYGFIFAPANSILSHKAIGFHSDRFSVFCILQSRVHQVWAYFQGSTMKDDPVYAPEDCYETFPFSNDFESSAVLEVTGKTYYEFRADLMIRNNEGLTKTYNRFHDPEEHDPEILKLRELHATMDRAVLNAYCWNNIQTDCEFLLDYEIDEEEWGKEKKPYRYRWPDEVRDEVLARLLELNAERAKEEARSGTAAVKKGGKKITTTGVRKTSKMEDFFS